MYVRYQLTKIHAVVGHLISFTKPLAGTCHYLTHSDRSPKSTCYVCCYMQLYVHVHSNLLFTG